MQKETALRLCRKAAEAIGNSVTVKQVIAYHKFSDDLPSVTQTEFELYYFVNDRCKVLNFATWTEVYLFLKQIILTKGANLVQKSNANDV